MKIEHVIFGIDLMVGAFFMPCGGMKARLMNSAFCSKRKKKPEIKESILTNLNGAKSKRELGPGKLQRS